MMKSSSLPTLILSLSTLAFGAIHAQQAPAPQPNAGGPPAALGANPEDPADAAAFKTPEERRSYALGVFLANQIKRSDDGSTKINLDEVEAGVKAGLSGEKSSDFVTGANLANMLVRDGIKVDQAILLSSMRENVGNGKSKLTENGLRNEMQTIQQEAMQRRQEKAKIEGEQNLKDATTFLEKNAKSEGVTTTPTGLQFKVLKKGEGAKPKEGELVSVNFVGMLGNGKEFDRSPAGQPRILPQTLNKGWQEAMQMMEIGSKYQLWVPPALGFGETGRPPLIKPNALLSYEVELVATQAAPVNPQMNQGVSTPPISIPGTPRPDPNRKPISATTPPVSIEIPPQKPAPTPAPEQKK